MNLRTIIIVILLFITIQNILAQNRSYIHYHIDLIEARIAIIDKDYNQALTYYQNAFSKVDYQFSTHLRNAAICAAIMNKDSIMYKYIKQYLVNGGRFSFFNEDSILFKKYYSDPRWTELENNNVIYKKEYSKSLNVRYVELLDSLDIVDQKYRKKKTIMGIGKKNKVKKIHMIDSTIHITMDSLRQLYGYPSYRNIGMSSVEFICYHHRTSNLKYIETIEYKALKEGDITPDYYIYAYNRYQKGLTCPDKYLLSNDTLGLNAVEINIINKDRAKVGYASIDQMIKIEEYFNNKDKNIHGFSIYLF